jgi:hypothetical protein
MRRRAKLSFSPYLVRHHHRTAKQFASTILKGDTKMHYMLLIYNDQSAEAQLSPEAQQAEMNEYFAFNAEAQKRGVFAHAEALMPTHTATTVRVRDGKTLTTDGPFAETKEQLGGYYMLNCKDLDEAIEMAAKIPGARNGSVEIRPVVVFG